MGHLIVGLVEKVTIEGQEFLARIDTGAHHSSLARDIAQSLRLGPVLKTIVVKSSNGREIRPLVQARLEIGGKKLTASFNVSDRRHMKYQVLIGQNVLKQGFLIDPSKECP